MGERWQLTPPGTRDLLPDEASRSREVVDAVLGLLRRWGYREVVTPTLEYLDVLVRGEGTEAADRLFKLIDRGGELLALRPEMTTPVARLVATQLRHEPLPIRLAYAGQVFRGGEPGAGRLREFPQVGCELVGADSPEADAEIVALAVEALRAAGVGQFSLSVGHGGFLRSLLEGPRPGAEALQALEELLEMVRAYGVDDRVTIDLSIIRDFDYYTGIVFEGHTSSLGVPLLGGGRYDRLLERFGVPYPATGFALRIERVLAAEAPGTARRAPDVVVAFDGGGREAALRYASVLRSRGLVVEVEVRRRPWDDVVREALARGAAQAVFVRSGDALVRDGTGDERRVSLGSLAGALP